MQQESVAESPFERINNSAEENATSNPEFKKPVLVGRIGKLPHKLNNATDVAQPDITPVQPDITPVQPKDEQTEKQLIEQKKSHLPPAVLLKELTTPIPYKEPKWSGLPPQGSNYKLEVLKSGIILEEVNLFDKPYHVFGRLANCDVVMAHPTISRHHAVLQYKSLSENDGDRPPGFYVYDCGSTHGTFLNKSQIPAKMYVRVRVGHIIKLGCSTRSFILLGPDWDAEGESDLSITEMKQKHSEMKVQREKDIREALEKREQERLEEERRREEAGIDWGMGEDAEDEPDLADNPFASTANEQLYLDDPKKTLRGYFEREGHELTYDCEERTPGQFACRVELPMEDSRGRSVIAEAVHRGKKKEAVVACALEACRILDRHGLLRQAKHESRRRKQRDWSADDFYDSDEDTFFERTGAVERKRTQRMKKYQAEKEQAPLTYNNLVKKCEDLRTQISEESRRLEEMRKSSRTSASEQRDEDDLDTYMKSLSEQRHSVTHKVDISKLKSEIAQMKLELSRTERLANIAKPADLPELRPPPAAQKLRIKVGSSSVIYGKRLKLKEDKEKVKKEVVKKQDAEFVEEMDSDEETSDDRLKVKLENKDELVQNHDNKLSDKIDQEVADKTEVLVNTEEKDDSLVDIKKRVYGPMRPPTDYVIPESYLSAETDRDEQQIMEDD